MGGRDPTEAIHATPPLVPACDAFLSIEFGDSKVWLTGTLDATFNTITGDLDPRPQLPTSTFTLMRS